MEYPALAKTAFHYPAIDNHAHPLLKEAQRNAIPFESAISEAQGAALKDSVHTLACYRAIRDLVPAYGLESGDQKYYDWDALKACRASKPYDELCTIMMRPCNIQCILLDDGLGGVEELAEPLELHDKFCSSGARRVVRIEVEAEKLFIKLFAQQSPLIREEEPDDEMLTQIMKDFQLSFRATLVGHAKDKNTVAFKSIACYRGGLNIELGWSWDLPRFNDLRQIYGEYKQAGKIRLAAKWLIDLIVIAALEISSEYDKPVQFHTGLGDSDIVLNLSSPSHLQTVIKAYPKANFILLHSSYPYTREAGYLTAIYANVYLDFGEVFPFVSQDGQESIILQILELAPTNKILWSTDGHWFPESFYLGTIQSRKALYKVFSDMITSQQLSEVQAVEIVQKALFHNANRVYNLGLEPMLG